MLIDSTLMLSDKQAVTASAASENIIDQTAAGDAHRHAAVVAQADEDFAGLTNLKISLQNLCRFRFCQSGGAGGGHVCTGGFKGGQCPA